MNLNINTSEDVDNLNNNNDIVEVFEDLSFAKYSIDSIYKGTLHSDCRKALDCGKEIVLRTSMDEDACEARMMLNDISNQLARQTNFSVPNIKTVGDFMSGVRYELCLRSAQQVF